MPRYGTDIVPGNKDRDARPGPVAKQKPKPPVRPDDRADRPAVIPRPTGKPVPSLQKLGYSGSMQDFNRRLEAVDKAHLARFGYKPSPGLVFDVARSSVRDADLAHLFDASRSKRGKRNASVVFEPKALEAAGREGREAYQDLLDDDFTTQDVLEAGLGENAVGYAKFVWKGNKQVAFALKDAPAGVVQAVNAFRKDFSDGFLSTQDWKGPLAEWLTGEDPDFSTLVPKGKRTGSIVRATVEQIKRDVQHPKDNPGFLALDILGFSALGAGGVARVAAAGRAAGAAAKTRALLEGPGPQTFEIGLAGAKESVLLSENASVRAVQRFVLDERQKRFEKRVEAAQQIPAGEMAIAAKGVARTFIRRNFSFENKLERLARRRQRAEEQLRLLPKRELEYVTGWSTAAHGMFSRLPTKLRKGLTVGEQKALFALALDDPNPVGTLRVFHTRMIEQGVGDADAHRAHLVALTDAEKILKNPAKQSKRFQQAYVLARSAVDEMERIKIEELGLSPLTAEARVASLGDVVRTGKPVRPRAELVASYERRFGDVIDTDFARELIPGYAVSKESRARLAPRIHEQASAIAKEAYRRRLARPTSETPRVRILGGGPGAGKTTAVGTAKPGRIVYDTSLSDLGAATEKIEQALSSGRRVAIEYVYRDPVVAFRGMLDRASAEGRIVPIDEFVRMHVESNRVIREIDARYKADARVAVRVLDNSKLDAPEIALSELPKLRYAEVDHAVRAELKREVEAGRVPDFVRRAVQEAYGRGSRRDAGESRRGSAEVPAPGAEGLAPRPLYVPTVSAAKTKKAPRFPFLGVRVGPFGVPKPRPLPELSHEFTGKAIIAGDIRLDTTNLIAEAYGRTVRKAALVNDYDRLKVYATAKPRSEWDVPIRNADKIPERLRAIVADVDAGDIGGLSPADHKAILDALYPGEYDSVAKRWRAKPGEDLKDVQWVDQRLIHDYGKTPAPPGALTRAAQAVNEPFRVAILFARPAYALNIVSNTAALLIHNAAENIPAFTTAIRAPKAYGRQTTLALDNMVGAGKARSYVDDTILGKSNLVGRKLAEGWNVVADQYFRRTAAITEARKLGYDTPQKPMGELFKPANIKDYEQVKVRANKAVIEFDNLTWYEKNYARHAIFVYPFISRGTVWSLRTILEHPAKVDMLAHLGENADLDEVMKYAPEWVRRRGYFPVAWRGGKPIVVDSNTVNTFSLLSEMVHTAEAQFLEDDYSSINELFGPAAEFAVHWTTGRDEFGNDYPNGDFFGAANELLMGLPQALAVERSRKEIEPLKTFDVTDRESLAARERSALKRSVLSAGWLDGYGMLITGGMTPRPLDPMASAARYWKDRPLQERHEHEQELIRKALNLQAKFLSRPVPADVKDAIGVADRVGLEMKLFTDENGRTPTPKERTTILVDLLEKEGRLSGKRLEATRKRLKGKLDENGWKAFRAALLEEYANAEALQDWDADVRLVASFNRPVLTRKLHTLKADGLVSSAVVDADQETLYEYGRRYLAYAERLRELRGRSRELLDKEGRSLAYAEMRALEQQMDKPVTVNGKTLPSLVRLAWAHLSDRQRKEAKAEAAGRFSWGTISPLMKEMLGRKQPPTVAKGWLEFERLKDEVRQGQPVGERAFPVGYELELVKYVDRYLAKGFYKDWLFSKEPRARRLQQLSVVQKSPNRAEWDTLLNVAAPYASGLRAGDVDKGAARDVWHDYVETTLIPWVEANPKFGREVAMFGPNLLYGLIDG